MLPSGLKASTDREGNIFLHPEGDLSAPASAIMAKKAFFFDAIIRQEPFEESGLNPEDNLEEYRLISQEDLNYWENELKLIAESGRAVCVNFGGMALGDISAVPGLGLKYPRGIRDISEWYISTLLRQDYIHAVFEKQTEISLENLKQIYKLAGNLIDVIYICGTDFGTQTSLFCSADVFNELYLPYYKKLNDWIHNNTTWKTFKHSCGAVESLMPYFIEAGFDIINPVQISATGMDPVLLKSRYGGDLTFWGGGVDTQRTLPFGTIREVKEEVIRQCSVFSRGGGFVFNSVHNIQANTPIENVLAMFEALREFR